MSIWHRYDQEQRDLYVRFLQIYGAITKLFYQKKGDLVPYLDSKFQETVFAKVFNGENVDMGNTPHDILLIFGDLRIGIGIKTWVGSKPSYQKVMQLKRFKSEIDFLKKDLDSLAVKISMIKNERMRIDYERLGLSHNDNIYHYVTRDKGFFTINECSYPLVDMNNLGGFCISDTSFSWSDGRKNYRYTFGDSQIWQKFDSGDSDNIVLGKFEIAVMDDPFEFLLNAYESIRCMFPQNNKDDFIEIYLPLYSFKTKDVEKKSGLNAWNAAPKNKSKNTPRPLNEVYIPVPIEFHRKFPDFFCDNILDVIERKRERNECHKEIRFDLILPNGKTIPALLTGSNMKNLQSGSATQIDPETGRYYGQSALEQWLLVDVLGLSSRELVTKNWLDAKGVDSVRLWRKKDSCSPIYIDLAQSGSFELFMHNEPVLDDDF